MAALGSRVGRTHNEQPQQGLRHLILHVPPGTKPVPEGALAGSPAHDTQGHLLRWPTPLAADSVAASCVTQTHTALSSMEGRASGRRPPPARSWVMDDPCQGPIPVCVTPLLAAWGQSHRQDASPQDLPSTSTALRQLRATCSGAVHGPHGHLQRHWPNSGFGHPCLPRGAARALGTSRKLHPHSSGAPRQWPVSPEAQAGSLARGRGEFLLEPSGQPARERNPCHFPPGKCSFVVQTKR